MNTVAGNEPLHDEWIAVVAHDLRAPITIIRGYAQWLERIESRGQLQVAEQHQARRCIEAILDGTRQLNRMVSDLLDVSRLEAQQLPLRLKRLDLCALIRDFAERSTMLLEDHQLVVIGCDGPAIADVDPDRIGQVLSNLLSNGAKYGNPGAALRVEVEERNSELLVGVSNEGPGIPPEQVNQLFDRFHRVPSANRGTESGLGLGLYICKSLVEAHGGRIWAESEVGGLTTVTFSLPLVYAESCPGRGLAEVPT